MLYFVKDYARFENITVNDTQADFIGTPLEENRLSTTGDFSASSPANVMLPNSPIPPDDEAPF